MTNIASTASRPNMETNVIVLAAYLSSQFSAELGFLIDTRINNSIRKLYK